jgi:hypothetical protein
MYDKDKKAHIVNFLVITLLMNPEGCNIPHALDARVEYCNQ